MKEAAPFTRPGTILLLAVWFGLTSGLTEALVLAIRAHGLGHIIHVGWHFPWMAPLANTGFFLLAGLPLALAALVLPRWTRFRLVVFVYLAMAVGALLLMYPRVQPWASALLAIGIAFQAARTLARHREGMVRLARRTTLPLAAAVVLLAVGMLGWQRLERRNAVAGLPTAAAGAPNILLIILDTVRAANLSLYGYQRPTTPSLEALARKGTRFDQAYSPAPWTLPSHASLLTGRWPHELSADWVVPLDAEWPTLAEFLAGKGYVTGGFVANVGYCSWEFGLDRGFSHYRDFPLTVPTVIGASSIGRQLERNLRIRNLLQTDEHLVRVAAPSINGAFLDWVDDRDGRPFFAMLNFYDAHGPYLPEPPYDTMFAPEGRRANLSPLHRYLARPRRTLLSPEVIEREIAQYDGAIAYLDQELGNLFRALEARGLMENTVIVVTADHGEEFGEHGIYDHGNTLYRPSVHVPLVLVAPGGTGPSVITRPVSLRDVPRTLAELATGSPGPFPGRSLAALPADSAAQPEPVLAEVRKGLRTPAWHPVTLGDMYSVTVDSFRLIVNGDGREELYRVYADPWEQNPVASDTVARRLRDILRETKAGERGGTR